jgi:hypothetical protein
MKTPVAALVALALLVVTSEAFFAKKAAPAAPAAIKVTLRWWTVVTLQSHNGVLNFG